MDKIAKIKVAKPLRENGLLLVQILSSSQRWKFKKFQNIMSVSDFDRWSSNN